MLGRLFTLWLAGGINRENAFPETIVAQRLISRDDGRPCSTIQPEEFESFIQKYSERGDMFEKSAALVIAYYLRTPWSDTELAERVREWLKSYDPDERTMHELLEQLGEEP